MHRGGFIYGTHGRADVPPVPALRCVELATGKVRWSVDDFGDCMMLRQRRPTAGIDGER